MKFILKIIYRLQELDKALIQSFTLRLVDVILAKFPNITRTINP